MKSAYQPWVLCLLLPSVSTFPYCFEPEELTLMWVPRHCGVKSSVYKISSDIITLDLHDVSLIITCIGLCFESPGQESLEFLHLENYKL